MNEFEFHISPAASWSRPQTSAGTDGARSSTRRARRGSVVSSCGLSTASAMSGMTPLRPAAQLIAEDSQAPGPLAADGTSGDDTAFGSVVVRDRRLFDHEASLRHTYLERGVIEVAGGSMSEQRRSGLVDAAVDCYGMSARAERQPVQINGDILRVVRDASERARHVALARS